MSLKKYIVLFMVLVLILSALPLAMAAQADETGETAPVEEPVQEKQGIPWAVAAAILALITTMLQNKFIHGRR